MTRKDTLDHPKNMLLSFALFVESVIGFMCSTYGIITAVIIASLMTISLYLDVLQTEFNLLGLVIFVLVIVFVLVGRSFSNKMTTNIYMHLLHFISLGWILVAGFAIHYQNYGLIAPNSNGEIIRAGKDCLYFSLVTWTTLGYGDFLPTSSIRLVAGFQAVMGSLFTTLLMASLVFQLQRQEMPEESIDKYDSNS